MLKHYFRRKNPVLYGEDQQTKNISAGNAAEKRPDGQPEYELLTTVTDNVAQSVIESVLRAEDISYVVRESGNESWRRAILGVNRFGTEIYVPADLLETAKALIEGDGEPAGDLAETGKIPDVVADAGGWAAYNAAHGLDPDNRELPGDLAELGLIPDAVSEVGGWAIYNERNGLAADNRELVPEPEGDLAELGLIPDIVADAGGWAAYNAAHGLDPDNRELPGDLAELGLIPDEEDAFNKKEENLKDGGKNA